MNHQHKTTPQHAMTKPIPMHGDPAHPDAPTMSQSGMEASVAVRMQDEFGNTRDGQIAAERPLTVYIDRREIVTLMTLGTQPELLILGWLRNQRFVQRLSQIKVIQVDWETEAAAVITRDGIDNLDKRLSKRTVTTGCGQGTVFGSLLDDLDTINLPQPAIKQSEIYRTLRALSAYNEVYRKAGAVHGCALCHHDSILSFVEDVGRHNAVDTIAGHMWLNGIDGGNKLFYTTGRLTSEMVIKVAQMGVPILLSRSGVTQMGLDLAQRLGVILIARAKGKHFLVYHGQERVVLDDIPPARPTVDDNIKHRRPPHTGREKS